MGCHQAELEYSIIIQNLNDGSNPGNYVLTTAAPLPGKRNLEFWTGFVHIEYSPFGSGSELAVQNQYS